MNKTILTVSYLIAMGAVLFFMLRPNHLEPVLDKRIKENDSLKGEVIRLDAEIASLLADVDVAKRKDDEKADEVIEVKAVSEKKEKEIISDSRSRRLERFDSLTGDGIKSKQIGSLVEVDENRITNANLIGERLRVELEVNDLLVDRIAIKDNIIDKQYEALSKFQEESNAKSQIIDNLDEMTVEIVDDNRELKKKNKFLKTGIKVITIVGIILIIAI